MLDPDGQLQLRAANALIRLGPAAAPAVCDLLEVQNRMVPWIVVGLGPAVIPHLINSLRDRRPDARRVAAWALWVSWRKHTPCRRCGPRSPS